MFRTLAALLSVAVLAVLAGPTSAQALPPQRGGPTDAIADLYTSPPAGCVSNGPATVSQGPARGQPHAIIVQSAGVTCKPGSGLRVNQYLKIRYKSGGGYVALGGYYLIQGIDGAPATTWAGAFCGADLPAGVAYQGVVVDVFRSATAPHAIVSQARFLSASTVKCPA